MQELANEYAIAVHENIKKNDETSREDGANKKRLVQRYYRKQAEKLVPDDIERHDIILDLYYGNTINRQFAWDTIGNLIIRRLRELT
jgi:predicted metal-dependent hydrolase